MTEKCKAGGCGEIASQVWSPCYLNWLFIEHNQSVEVRKVYLLIITLKQSYWDAFWNSKELIGRNFHKQTRHNEHTCPQEFGPMSNHVLLFRLPSSEDEYHLQLSFHGYSPHSISPLDTELCNIERLADFIYSDSVSGSTNQHGFDGVIITSSRSIEALVAAIQSRKHGENKYLSKWRGTSFYVVGSKTASFLHQALSGTSLRPDDIRILGATESGNAEKLAEFIINTIGDRKQRLLYLTGDKNRDTLSNKLNEGRSNIELVSLQVYATCESAFLRNEIEKYGREMRPGTRTTFALSVQH